VTQIASEKEARLTYLKRELARSVTHSRYFNQRNCHYEAPTRVIPQRVKKLIKEIETLEINMGAEESRRAPSSGRQTKAPARLKD